MATGPEAQVPGSSSPNAMGDDSALHDSVMFGEDDPSASSNPVPPPGARTTVTCPSANGDMDMCAQTPSMRTHSIGIWTRCEAHLHCLIGLHVSEIPHSVLREASTRCRSSTQ